MAIVIKQSLREMQERLAARLQQARAGGDRLTASWLAVAVEDTKFLLQLNQIGEIFPWSAPQIVPRAKSWYLGVVNLRGSLAGVIDLACLLRDVMHGQSQFMRENLGQGKLVALHSDLQINCAFYVDELLGLKNANSMKQLTNLKLPMYVKSSYLEESSGIQWLELDLQALVQDDRFLDIVY